MAEKPEELLAMEKAEQAVTPAGAITSRVVQGGAA
jgi:cytochrome bd ubiquinol oxidase subunit I